MAAPTRVYIFGDQTFDTSESLSELLQTEDPILAAFFERSCFALRRHIAEIDPSYQSEFPRFSTIADLNTSNQKDLLNPALAQFLTCACQLGLFIRLHGPYGLSYPTRDSACLVGLCTGTLSAAAVSCSQSLSDLLDAAVEAAILAFKAGFRSWDVSRRVYSTTHTVGRSWALAVLSGISLEQATLSLRQFSETEHLPRTSIPYISLSSSSTLTISGPPATLSKLRGFPAFSKCSFISLPINSPYHAPHLFSQNDIDRIIGNALLPKWSSRFSRVPVVPHLLGDGVPLSNFSQAIRHAVDQILIAPVQWDTILEQVTLQGRKDQRMCLEIIPIATKADRLIRPAVEKLLSTQTNPSPLIKTLSTARPDLLEPSWTPASKTGIAIVSVSGRFPSASGMDELWDLLYKGLDVHKVVPPDRWDAKSHFEQVPSRKNTSGTAYGCWLEEAGLWDARFFNISPREAPQIDPAQRLALLTAAEAIERAGIVPDRTPSTRRDRVGVWYGCTSNDWMETNSAQDIDAYFIPGGNRAFIPGRINYHYKFSGPSYTIDTACSSSLAAIHMACNALWRLEADTAITGGTNVLTNPDMTAGLDRGHFLSRSGNCKTFDEEADGYCRGEGVATIILKRLDDAMNDKDPILGVIRGIATNHSAEASSITRPHVPAQRNLFENILTNTGLSSNDISYVEMHGTGTQVGDAGETASVLETFASADPARKRLPHQTLHIGSVKANIGHGEAVAGASSLAKVLLMLKNSIIPPHCGIKHRINHRIPDLGSRNTFIAQTPVPWPRPQNDVRRVFLCNFSAAGGNTALLMEDGPMRVSADDPDLRRKHIVTLSAKTYVSLEGNLKSLIDWLDKTNDDGLLLPRASYTLTARRLHYPHRIAATGSTFQEIKTSLQRSLMYKEGSYRPSKTPEICFAFTGQGSQYGTMGLELYALFSTFRENIRRYDQIAQTLGFPTFQFLFERPRSLDQQSPTVVQLASTCLQMALARLYISWGINANIVVGHSLGEYAALNVAGVLSEADTIYLVGTRASLLVKSCELGTHVMLAVRTSTANVRHILGDEGNSYEISCVNGSEDLVLGGERNALKKASERLEQNGIRTTILEVPFAFHTSQVDPILEEFTQMSRGANFQNPSLPFISPLLGRVIYKGDVVGPEYLTSHCRKAVNMFDAVQAAKAESSISEKTITIEIGPAPVVSRMLGRAVGSDMKMLYGLQKGKEASSLLPDMCAYLYCSGVDINWPEYHRDFKSAQKVVDLPTYHWDLKNYWIQYVHDWSLRKGDPFQALLPRLESSTVHRVVKEDFDHIAGALIVESDLNRPDMHGVVQGHKVWGVPLCTPSVYADIALTIGQYIHQRYWPSSLQNHVEIGPMNIQSALVANDSGAAQILRTEVQVDPKAKIANCKFSSIDETGKLTEQHSNCGLSFFHPDTLRKELSDKEAYARSRIEAMSKQISEAGNTYRFSKNMIYKMITQLADFDPNYRGLVGITLDNDQLEASGHVSFKNVKKGGSFHTNPAFIDALSQLGGFVMNANESVDLEKEVFINHGWDSMQFFDRIDEDKEYRTHVRMQEGLEKLWKGDVTILDDKEGIVGFFGGVALQGVPKRLMQVIVDSASKRSQRKPASHVKASATTRTSKTAQAPDSKSIPPSEASQLILRAMQILSEESGVAAEELADNSQLSDLGIDSLMSLVIGSRYRDDLGIDLESATLIDFTTVQDVKDFVKTQVRHAPMQQEHSTSEIIVESTTIAPLQLGTTKGNAVWSDVLKIISEESGISMSELSDDTAFVDIGIDSLLALVISSRLRDEVDLDLPLDASLFIDNQTIRALRHNMANQYDTLDMEESSLGSSPQTGSSSTDATSLINTPTEATAPDDLETHFEVGVSNGNDDDTNHALLHLAPGIRPAWSLVLQGSPRKAEKILFLFPDGCGAASSYLGLSRVSPLVAVVGFNCPFMKNPEDMPKHSLASIISSYIEGLRRHQPNGPYHLGGWSAGGILAYAIATTLVDLGEKVHSITCIDSPPPTKGLDRLPQRFFDHCSNVGIFGKELSKNAHSGTTDHGPRKAPEWLMPHFKATIDILHEYIAQPMLSDHNSLSVNILWAGECALDGVRYPKLPPATDIDEDTEGMKFLTEKRNDFGPGDWATLFPGQDIRTETVLGEDHFSMMRGSGGEQISRFIEKVMRLA
ncbi:MAG: hypothetical protein Q9227_009027 [Pyrenula ochraceoflavens]